jgi:uncharacterized protein
MSMHPMTDEQPLKTLRTPSAWRGSVVTGGLLLLLAVLSAASLQPVHAQATGSARPERLDVQGVNVQVPLLTGRVVDQAALLDSATERALTRRLAAHEDSTSNQVAVLTIASLEGRPIEEVALAVARTWALGQAGRDNGVLLLIARDDRQMRIEVGYGLEGALPDVVASRIIRHELRPAFRAGDFDGGVQAGVAAILQAITGSYQPPPASAQAEQVPPLFFRLAFLIGFVIIPLVSFGPIFFLSGLWGWMGFVGLFFCVGWGIVFFSLRAALAAIPGYVVLIGIAEWWFRRQPGWKDFRRKMKEANQENEGRSVELTIGKRTFMVPSVRSGGGSASIGSSGGFSSGGGFSGGGGSFGGGGASGGW